MIGFAKFLYFSLLQIGIDLRKLSNLIYTFRFLKDMLNYKRKGGRIGAVYPIISDYKTSAGTARGHYFHQDLLVATSVYERNPMRHIDFGSRIDGFIAHVATFREIEVFDIRKLNYIGHENIKFIKADLLNINKKYYSICDSLSCLHVLEHIGLGRYGDAIDPLGHITAFNNLYNILSPGGILYISFPIGHESIYFNAHRVFNPHEILTWSKDRFNLISFDFVDDAGELHRKKKVTDAPSLNYGCGIYTLRKI